MKKLERLSVSTRYLMMKSFVLGDTHTRTGCHVGRTHCLEEFLVAPVGRSIIVRTPVTCLMDIFH